MVAEQWDWMPPNSTLKRCTDGLGWCIVKNCNFIGV